jgi:hypothetical protein
MVVQQGRGYTHIAMNHATRIRNPRVVGFFCLFGNPNVLDDVGRQTMSESVLIAFAEDGKTVAVRTGIYAFGAGLISVYRSG